VLPVAADQAGELAPLERQASLIQRPRPGGDPSRHGVHERPVEIEQDGGWWRKTAGHGSIEADGRADRLA
jgi:hypothetical protein